MPHQGATLAIVPKRHDDPTGDTILGSECVSQWTISGPARFNADHSKITIDEAAPPGSEVIVRYRVRNLPVERRLRVVARDPVVLTGVRSQTGGQGCPHASNVGELEFGPGIFSVTFVPFETYRDYWGTYSYDPSSGALRMSVEGGNRVPAELDLEGRAVFENGQLVLEDMFLGNADDHSPIEPCRYVF